MAISLNLAALTDEELHLLFGDERALALLPEVSRARLSRRPEPGPELPGSLCVRPLTQRLWGGTPEQSRVLDALDAAVQASGAQPQGASTWIDDASGDHLMPYSAEPATSVVLRWNEASGASGPALEALSWLRDQASGFTAVLTTGRVQATVPAASEEVDVHLHPGLAAGELLTLHAGHVLRHGRAQKLAPEAEWWTPWQALYGLNLRAWARRGLLLGLPTV